MSKILEKFIDIVTDVLEIAIRVRTPLMLAGLLAGAFFLILLAILLILRRKIPKLRQDTADDIIKLIIKSLYRLTLVAVVLGFVGFLMTILIQSPIPPDDPENEEKYPAMVSIPNREFSIGKYEITNQQYREFLKDSGHKPSPVFWDDEGFNSDNQPVVGISWHDAMKYCDWLSNETKETYQLPTKEQWDMASGGEVTDTEYPWENQIISGMFEMINIGRRYNAPRMIDRPQYSVYEPDFGIRDMIGNVAEWCLDGTQDRKIVCGGSWSVNYEEVRKSESHRTYPPETRDKDDLGFRVVKLDKVQQPEQGESLE